MKFSTIYLSLFLTSAVLAEDRWPAQWCDKECIETCLFAQGCIESGRPCRCSSHFQTKLNKCKADGCEENYVNKNWSETVTPLLDDCTGKYYDGPI
ncbi:hypothetical protein CAAN1_03S01684 [[Candida] anglica]|uniref:Extracellular membrane protein CFEM domain-containing protein n=1 Tax=[Candida] anglica TaxID=148631 RepID=A0ABP0EH37_9ASCO